MTATVKKKRLSSRTKQIGSLQKERTTILRAPSAPKEEENEIQKSLDKIRETIYTYSNKKLICVAHIVMKALKKLSTNGDKMTCNHSRLRMYDRIVPEFFFKKT